MNLSLCVLDELFDPKCIVRIVISIPYDDGVQLEKICSALKLLSFIMDGNKIIYE